MQRGTTSHTNMVCDIAVGSPAMREAFRKSLADLPDTVVQALLLQIRKEAALELTGFRRPGQAVRRIAKLIDAARDKAAELAAQSPARHLAEQVVDGKLPVAQARARMRGAA